MSLRFFCLLVLLLAMPIRARAQEALENATPEVPVTTVSASQSMSDSKSPPDLSTPDETTETPNEATEVTEPFRLPAQHHAWARFQPGAWREVQTRTAKLDDLGKVVQQSFSTQKETLEAVAEGKYVLKVQATVEVGGKQIVGEETTRVLHLETDGAGTLSESTRLDDQSLAFAGRRLNCQVWEIQHQEGDRRLRDLIHYSTSQFPHILRRETVKADNMPLGDENQQTDKPAEASLSAVEHTTEVIALETPFIVDDQFLTCTSLRSVHQDAKGGSVRLVLIHREIPGGEVRVRSTEFDAQGRSLRFSETTLLGYGGQLIDNGLGESSTEPELPVDEPQKPQ